MKSEKQKISQLKFKKHEQLKNKFCIKMFKYFELVK